MAESTYAFVVKSSKAPINSINRKISYKHSRGPGTGVEKSKASQMLQHILLGFFLSLITSAFGDGSDNLQPRLSPSVLAQLHRPRKAKKELLTEEVLTCYNGYELIDRKCVKRIDEPAVLRGALTIPYVAQCPADYNIEDGHCIRLVETEPQYFCPVDYEDDVYDCVKTSHPMHSTKCLRGEMHQGHCYYIESVPQIITAMCPPEAELGSDGNCWQTIGLFDCTDVPIAEGIPKRKAKLRRLGAKKKGTMVEIETDMVAVTAPRPVLVGLARQQCEKKVQVDAFAVVSCPEDFVDDGERCIRQIFEDAVEYCPATGDLGRCSALADRVPKMAKCLNGTPLRTGLCLVKETVPAIHRCPAGFVDTGVNCLGEVEEKTYECPPGLLLVGDRCLGESVRPAVTLKLTENDCGETKY